LPPPALRDDSELDALKAQLGKALEEVALLKVRLSSQWLDCAANDRCVSVTLVAVPVQVLVIITDPLLSGLLYLSLSPGPGKSH
jgi:hypothetical protein